MTGTSERPQDTKPASDCMLRISGLTKKFGDNEVLRGIDLEVAAGEVVAVIGPSGSGKSTLLRCTNLMELPDGGKISFAGNAIFGGGHKLGKAQRAEQRTTLLRIGMVFQQFNLFPHLTALNNATEAPISVLGQPRKEVEQRVRELFESVGLADKLNAKPRTLSGGQQQRVAIVRALAMQPSLMLFDEPTSALDPEMVGEVLTVIRNVADQGMTMLIVTHEMAFAQQIADRVVIVKDGEIIEQGPPGKIFTDPDDERSKQFLDRVLNPAGMTAP